MASIFDGCLADFNSAFIRRIIDVTGRNLFPEGYEPHTWDYPEALGYSPTETDEVWRSIKQDRMFWATLPAYPTTPAFLGLVATRSEDDFYFITARPGIQAKRQTEEWLFHYTPWSKPLFNWTVLVSSHKGLCAQALGLDRYLDDKWENAESIATTNTKSYLLDRPWNQQPNSQCDLSIAFGSEVGVRRIYQPSDIFRD